MLNVVRIILWLAIVAGLLRGILAFDAGPSAVRQGGGGAIFAGALVAATLMFCFDLRGDAGRPRQGSQRRGAE